PDVIFVAHNAGFEQAMWREHMTLYGFDELPIERWDCTMAACAWKGLPLALDRAGRFLGLDVAKDKEGRNLTVGLSTTWRKTGVCPDHKLHLPRILDYCEQDVVVERGVRRRVGLISQ